RHFTGKEELARDIFMSWYGWHCTKLQRIVSGSGNTLDQLPEIVGHEFSAVTAHRDAVTHTCWHGARFLRHAAPWITDGRRVFAGFINAGQGCGEVRLASPRVACRDAKWRPLRCRAGLAWHGAAEKAQRATGRSVDGCWRMIAGLLERRQDMTEEQLIQRYFD